MSVLDRIYEAAFVPELWPEVLGQLATRAGAHSGAILIVDPRLPPLFSATPNVVDTLADFSRGPVWYENAPALRLRRMKYPGFLERADFFTEDERNGSNPYDDNMVRIGADWQVGSVVDMPHGEFILFTFERQRGLPDFDKSDLALLDGFRPHLARASLMAWRLQLERANAGVAALEAIGIPAAIISARGVAIASNSTFEALTDVLRPAAFGRLAARDRFADQLLQAALPGQQGEPVPEVRSIPMQLVDSDRAIVAHVIPLRRSASDIFDQGAAMVAVTGYSADGNVPTEPLLRGLFDLSVAEARIAAGLAAGLTLAEVAQQRGIGMATARTHLAQVLRKTGTRQQGQLIALLKGVSGALP